MYFLTLNTTIMQIKSKLYKIGMVSLLFACNNAAQLQAQDEEAEEIELAGATTQVDARAHAKRIMKHALLWEVGVLALSFLVAGFSAKWAQSGEFFKGVNILDGTNGKRESQLTGIIVFVAGTFANVIAVPLALKPKN